MRNQKNKRNLLALAFCMTALFASAQKTFRYQAKLDTVDSAGFYKITLSPALVAKSNPGLTDLRLTDSKGRFIPYISSENLPHIPNDYFISFPEVVSKKDTGTTFVIEAKIRQPVNRIWLKLKSTAVKRSINLSGSDDLQQWFAIEEDIPLQEAVQDKDGSYMQAITFPASNYRYLKLLVNDKNKTPVKFLEAGVYAAQSVLETYFPVTGSKLMVRDSNKTTYATLLLNDNYLINSLDFDIAGPKYYKRNVRIFSVNKKQRQLLATVVLNSSNRVATLINVKTNKLELEIDNGDNLPLDIKNIRPSQADQPIAAYLEAGQSYRLLTGNPSATAPVYDLKFFADSIRNVLPEIKTKAPVPNNAFAAPAVKARPRDYTVVIWIIILAALLLLTYLTLKMTKEINHKNKAE